jgi:hypothetical protein
VTIVGAPLVGVDCGSGRAATRGAAPTSIVLRLMFIVICDYSRRFVVVFAREIPRACKFHCSLQCSKRLTLRDGALQHGL